MPISFNCPSCGQPYKVPDEVAGRSTKCRKCSGVMQIPMASEAPEVPMLSIQPTPSAPAPAAFGHDAGTAPAAPAIGWKEQAQRLGQQAGPILEKLRTVPPKILIPVAGVVLLIFCLLPTFLVGRWMFGGGGGLGPGEKYLPDNCKYVASVRVEQVMKSPLVKQLTTDFPDLQRELKDNPVVDKATRMLVAGDFQEQERATVIILELQSALTVDDVKKVQNIKDVKEEKVGDFTIYRHPDAMEVFELTAAELRGDPRPNLEMRNAFCFPEKYLMLQGNASLIKSILQRGKKPELSRELQNGLREVDMNSSVAMVASYRGFPMPPAAPGTEKIREMADKLEFMVMSLNVSSDLELQAAIHCTDPKAAEDLRDILVGFRTLAKTFATLPKEAGEIIDAIKIDAKGKQLVFSLQLKQDTLTKGIKQMKGM